jgi:hypothetical protein
MCVTFFLLPFEACAMVEVMNNNMPSGRYRVVEVFGGIGCNTMAFMECRRIAMTDSVEGDSLTRQRLQANVAAWAVVLQCTPPNTHLVSPTCLDIVTLASPTKHTVENTAVFFDPPWGEDHPYLNPFSFKLADGTTVEDCVAQLLTRPHIHLVAVKVPKHILPLKCYDNVSVEVFSSLKKMDLLYFKRK